MSTDGHPPAGDAGGGSVPEASAPPSGADAGGIDRRAPLSAAEVRSLLREGTPIVGLADRRAFQQEAEYLRALSADNSRPVPRISIKIVPDPDAAVEEGEPAETSGKKGEA